MPSGLSLTTIDPVTTGEIEVLQTFVGGKKVFDRPVEQIPDIIKNRIK